MYANIKMVKKMNEDISILLKYGEELTTKEYITNPARARDYEINRALLVLLTPEKSVILTGKPGIGKTAIVEGIANRIAKGDVPDALKKYRIVKVNTPALLGVENGESRVLILMEELKKVENVILFIDEIHTLIQQDAKSALDLANMFKPGLDRGSIKVIGATTTAEYETYILRDKAFVRRFERVDVEEPSTEVTAEIMVGSMLKMEKKTGVKFDYPDYIKEKVCYFIANMTSEFKRVYEIGARYPDVSLAILAKIFSYALFDNKDKVNFQHIYNAIKNTKSVYPDVIEKDLVIFKEEFKNILDEEFVVMD